MAKVYEAQSGLESGWKVAGKRLATFLPVVNGIHLCTNDMGQLKTRLRES
jgi:hypothetical protein